MKVQYALSTKTHWHPNHWYHGRSTGSQTNSAQKHVYPATKYLGCGHTPTMYVVAGLLTDGIQAWLWLTKYVNSRAGVEAHSFIPQYQRSKTVSCFLSMTGEVDTHDIVREILSSGEHCCGTFASHRHRRGRGLCAKLHEKYPA